MKEVTVTYDDKSVRWFMNASIIWGIVGMLVGVIVATQLAFHQANFNTQYLAFGRLRPLHTNAVIFAFVGNMIFAGIYYSTQRLLKARMFSDLLSQIHFWGWQLIIVAAAVTLPLGITQSKEYAELEWPIDLAVVVVWVVFALNFFGTIAKRREKHLYVAIWFYIATIITVAMLYIVNNLALPIFGSGLKSYSLFAGVQDALIQWWYGHNAVAFFLTTPVLGIMYYFLPKAAERPVYSYRLSIVHFWALVFVYIWAGPHHLLYTALPDWAQSMGMIFSLMLWAPSWGGMLNGLLTLRGAWDKLRTDPIIKFLIAGVTFYGMATFEGPLLSIKSVSALGHYTDWIIGHVHSGALGWNGFMAFGMFYWLAPRLYGTKLHSKSLANTHFWVGTLGILLYAISMWVAGITQGLMWRAYTPEGALQYPSFVETLIAIRPMYMMRLVGGLMYFGATVLGAYNIFMTVKSGKPVESSVTVHEPETMKDGVGLLQIIFAPQILLSFAAIGAGLVYFVGNIVVAVALWFIFGAMVAGAVVIFKTDVKIGGKAINYHRILEGRAVIFSVLTAVAVIIGGVVEIVPTLISDKAIPEVGPTATPYRPLELEGRDIYVAEGCYLCHSQMVRPFRDEKVRYQNAQTGLSISHAGEFIYDHPFQWGSKRTGPDLHRVGGKMPNSWHYNHMMDPRSTSQGSNMPPYAWMRDAKIDVSGTKAKLQGMQTLGVPYSDSDIENGEAMLKAQAEAIVADLKKSDIDVAWDSKMVAIIAYLQRLGTHPDWQAPEKAPEMKLVMP